MGTSLTGADLADKLLRFASQIPQAQREALASAAVLIKAAVQVAAGQYAASPLAKVTIDPEIDAPGPTILMGMRNRKAHLLDHDTRTHEIGPKRASVVVINGQPVSGSVTHPGTTGKRMWEEGVAAATPLVANLLKAGIATALSDVFI